MNLSTISSDNEQLSARKYKMKLKEWKFEKYVRAADMKIVVAKATERARQDGRETAFYNAGQPLSAERIGNFKKRIALDEEEWISSSAGKIYSVP